ncbi:hypothetical protein H7I76_05485 [Mycolicibacterium vaccae]|nr:hypothetical protein [Mycolicibacterium vaccae]
MDEVWVRVYGEGLERMQMVQACVKAPPSCVGYLKRVCCVIGGGKLRSGLNRELVRGLYAIDYYLYEFSNLSPFGQHLLVGYIVRHDGKI